MRAKKAAAYIIAVLLLIPLSAGFVLEPVFKVCAKIDPLYWREHFISLISVALRCGFTYTLLCFYARARWKQWIRH